MKEDVKQIAKDYIEEMKKATDSIPVAEIEKIIEILMETYKNDRRVFIFGNGGSASTASHMACDLGKGTLRNVYDASEKRFQIISLTDNVAMMTAFSNDLSYEDIFVQQLKNYVQRGDVVIGISASGNSSNVIKALIYAKEVGAKTVGLLGFNTGGKAKDIVDYNIVIKSNNYGIVEDLHSTLNHIIASCLYRVKHVHDNEKK